MKVWEWLVLNKLEATDPKVDLKELMKTIDGERQIKDSIRCLFDYYAGCNFKLIELLPKDTYNWYMNYETECMKGKRLDGKSNCDICFDKLMNKCVIDGFIPVVIGGTSER